MGFMYSPTSITPRETKEYIEALKNENRILKGKLEAQQENAKFLEECIVEMAGEVYA